MNFIELNSVAIGFNASGFLADCGLSMDRQYSSLNMAVCWWGSKVGQAAQRRSELGFVRNLATRMTLLPIPRFS